MNKNRRIYGLLTAGCGILLFTACRKKEAPQPTPDLSIPAQTRQVLDNVDLRPAAEVVASSGPVQLTFRLYKTRIHHGESLWYQLELKNIGKDKFEVTDDIFSRPGLMETHSTQRRTGIYLDLLDASGKTPWLKLNGDMLPDGPTPGIALTDKQHAQIEAWQKAGLSYEQISIRISNELRARPAANTSSTPSFWLEPGASTTTMAWARQDPFDVYYGKPAPKPIGNYSELSRFFLMPGQYRIHAVYDESISKKLGSEYHLKPSERDVLIRTPVVEFEVVK